MQESIVPRLSTVVDQKYKVESPRAFYGCVAEFLAERGFSVQPVEPPLEGMAGPEFRAGLRGERDAVLDARRRSIGKAMVIIGALLTVITLGVMVSGEQRYWVFDWLLTVQVLMGGVGLMQLRNPADRRRTVVEIAMAGQADGLHVAVHEGVGKVEDDVIFDWLPDEPIGMKTEDIEALVTKTKRIEGIA